MFVSLVSSRSLITKALMIVTALGVSGCPGCNSPFGRRANVQVLPAPADIVEPAQVEADAVGKKPLPLPKVGDVLIFGGAMNLKGPIATAEFYDPSTKKFSSTGPLLAARLGPIGSELGAPLQGKVLVAGGLGGGVTTKKGTYVINAKPTDIELYDPLLGAFVTAASPPITLNTPRTGYTQTVLNNGKVLIAGGATTSGGSTNTAELYDPSTGTVSATGNMNVSRILHTATLLKNGTVLIAGGVRVANGFPATTNTAEIYDPSTGHFTPTIGKILGAGNVATDMAAHTATLIEGGPADGKVLLVGGFSNFSGLAVSTANTFATLYDPVAQTFTPTTGQPFDDRTFQTATLLENGKVLIAGGLYGQSQIASGNFFGIYGGVRSSAELYDPAANAFTCVPAKAKKVKPSQNCAASMVNSRAGDTATLMASGQVLLAGGVGAAGTTVRGQGKPLKSAEVYDPATNKFIKTGIMKAAHAGHGAVLLE